MPIKVDKIKTAKPLTDPVTKAGRDDKKPKRKPRMKKVSLAMCDAIVTFVALPVGAVWPEDKLTEVEMLALGQSMYDAAQSNPYIANIIHSLTQVGGVGELAATGAAIGARRVVRRVALRQPNGMADQRLIIINGASELILNGVASRRTPNVGGEYGQRQDDASESDLEASEIRNRPADEGGYPGVAGVSHGSNSRENPL